MQYRRMRLYWAYQGFFGSLKYYTSGKSGVVKNCNLGIEVTNKSKVFNDYVTGMLQKEEQQ